MLSSRLNIARDDGLLPLTARWIVFGARADDDLSALGADLQVVQGFFPDVAALRARGHDVVTEPSGAFDAALVVLPRAKAAARDLIAQAVVQCGTVWIDGQKTDGADGLIRDLRSRGTVSSVIAKAHGKLFAFTGADLSDWRAEATRHGDGAITLPGVFSADGPDRASVLLASFLPPKMPGVVVDLGAGWGYLAREILQREGVTACHLVEADHAALTCARTNVTDERAQFHWADALSFAIPGGADHVVTNPPFHIARAADPGLGRDFIVAAARLLKPQGKLWLVANRHLPYETALTESFSKVTLLSDDPAFKVVQAERPLRQSNRPSNRTARTSR